MLPNQWDIFSLFLVHDACLRSNISKTRASCFIGVSKHSKTIKALGLRPRAFISFLVFSSVFSCLETPMKHSHSFLIYYVMHCTAPRDGLKRARQTETWWTDRNDIMDVSHSIGTKRIRWWVFFHFFIHVTLGRLNSSSETHYLWIIGWSA